MNEMWEHSFLDIREKVLLKLNSKEEFKGWLDYDQAVGKHIIWEDIVNRAIDKVFKEYVHDHKNAVSSLKSWVYTSSDWWKDNYQFRIDYIANMSDDLMYKEENDILFKLGNIIKRKLDLPISEKRDSFVKDSEKELIDNSIKRAMEDLTYVISGFFKELENIKTFVETNGYSAEVYNAMVVRHMAENSENVKDYVEFLDRLKSCIGGIY